MKLALVLVIGVLFCAFLANNAIYPQHSVCGNGICEGGEDCENCSQDCGVCDPPDDETTDEDINTPIKDIKEQLQVDQLKIKRTTDFSTKGGVIDDLRIMWP